jgi:hypothetical protein
MLCRMVVVPASHGWYTDKKENNFFPIYEEIQSGAVTKSYMRKGFPIYDEAVSYI